MTLFSSRRLPWLAPALALFALAACDSSSSSEPKEDAGSDAEAPQEDADTEQDAETPEGDAETPDEDGGALDGGADAGGDAGAAGSQEKMVITKVSATGHDRFYAVTHDKSGNIYAVGQTTSTNLSGAADTGDYAVSLVKYKPDGALDTAFGAQGFAIKNVVETGAGPNREVSRGVVVQSTGKIVVAATVPHTPVGTGPEANDTDIAVLRFNADGSLDTGFGTGGVKILDITTPFVYQPANLADGGVPPMALSAADQQYSLTLAADDKLVIHGVELGAGDKAGMAGVKRTDSDWSLLRLTKDGELDTSFSSDGRVTLDIKEGGASARAATVLSDGSIIGVGYTSVAGVLDTTTTSRQQPVLFKVKSDGSFDDSFASADQYAAPGVFYDFITPKLTNAEAYGAAPQGNKFVSVGYGPTDGTGTGTDFIFARFNQDGSHDKTFGTGGATYMDPGGYGDNGRAVAVLPDDRIVGVGGGRAKPATPPAMGTNPPVDAMIAILKADGKPDTSFDEDGMKLYDFGGAADFFWGVDVAPDKKSVAVVGIATPSAESGNDDSVLLVIPLP